VPRDPALNANWDKISEQSKILCRSLKANIANAFLQEVAKLTQSVVAKIAMLITSKVVYYYYYYYLMKSLY
jgi:hypothetical protein